MERALAGYAGSATPEFRALFRVTLRGMYALIDRTRGEAVPVAEWPEWVA